MNDKILNILEKVANKELTTQKALFEILNVIEMNKDNYVKCTGCNGKGYHNDGKYKNECYKCMGSGFIIDSNQ